MKPQTNGIVPGLTSFHLLLHLHALSAVFVRCTYAPSYSVLPAVEREASLQATGSASQKEPAQNAKTCAVPCAGAHVRCEAANVRQRVLHRYFTQGGQRVG